jgi:hypothetical protein
VPTDKGNMTKTIDAGQDYRWIEAKRFGITRFYLPVAVFVILTKGGIPKNWEKPFCFYY